MEVQEHRQSAPWPDSIRRLLSEHEYGEAFALSEFFPATQERMLLQCLALLGQEKLIEANSLLEQLNIDLRTIPPNITSFIREGDLDLLNIANQAIKKLLFSTASFCIHLNLLTRPEATQKTIDEMLALTSRALIHGKLDFAQECFDHIANLDDSPMRLLQCAEIALANRTRDSAESLFELAQIFINRALPQVSSEDHETSLRAAKLLAVDARTFDDSCKLFRQILHSSPSMKARVFDTLLPLIEYKPYFNEIADFLLPLYPEKVAQLALRLVNGQKRQRNPALLEKARNILGALDYVGLGFSSQLAEAIVIVGRHSENFESHVQRLIHLEAAPSVFLEAFKVLVDRKSKEFGLMAQLLEHLLLLHPNSRLKVLSGYGQLSNLAERDGRTDLRDEFLERAITLSTGVEEFLAHAININLTHELLFLNNRNTHLKKALWFSQSEVDEVVNTLITSAEPYERKTALYALLDQQDQFEPRQLLAWIKALFRSDIGLTERDVIRIEEKRSPLAPEVQNELIKGLSKQKISESDIYMGGVHAMRSVASSIDSSVFYMRRTSDHSKEVYMELMELLKEAGDDERAALLEKFIVEERLPAKKRKAIKKTPTVRVERYTHVDFPNQCALETKVDLRIQLTKTPPAKTRTRKKLKIDVARPVKNIKIEINVTAPAFAMQERRKLMSMSVSKDSEEITFTLIPLELGEQVIEVEFFYESLRVGYILVKTRVRERAMTTAPSNMVVMETPSQGLKNSENLHVSPDRRVLHATWFDKENKLSYTVYSPGINESPEWDTHGPNLQGDVRNYLQQLNEFLSQVVVQGNPSDEEWDSTLLNLQGIGADLFNTLIPSPLATVVRNWREGSLVIVSTNEQWIPWELIYDGQGFWGKRFVIARLPRLSDRRRIPDTKRPEIKTRTRQIKRVVNVVGGDVGAAEAKQACELFDMLGNPIRVELLQEQPISVLNKALAKADVLHCTCHGHLEPHMLQVSKDKSVLTNLLPQTVQKLPLEPGSFVFANTCTSALPVLTFGRFSSFAWEFYRQGAGVFIGTLGAVPTTHAISFAESIYRELFNKSRKTTVGEAVNLAKNVIARERNLFWLLYCIYGDPDYVLSVPQHRRGYAD